MTLTPAEIVWGLIVALLLAAWAIAVLWLRTEDSGIPTDPVGPSVTWAQLAAEVTRTDTLLWYAGQLLNGQ